jgi:hypothetical protein
VSRVKEEKQRATALLPPQSWSIIEGVTERALLDCRLHDLASKGIRLNDHDYRVRGLADYHHYFPALSLYMGAKRMQDLTTLYSMYSRVGGIPILCAAFKDYVKVRKRSASNVTTTIIDDPNRKNRRRCRVSFKTNPWMMKWSNGFWISKLLPTRP